jgi:hypothetical protein
MKFKTICMLSFSFLGCAPVFGQKELWKEISNAHVRMVVPRSWEYMEGPQGVLFSVLSPLSSPKDSFRENFNMIRVSYPGVASHEFLMGAGDGMLQNMRSVLPDIALEQTDTGVFRLGNYLDVRASSSSSKLVWNWRIFVRDGSMFFFTATGRKNSEDAVLFWNELKGIMNRSLELKPQKAAE